MNRVEIKEFAKKKIQGHLWDIWKIVLMTYGIFFGFGFLITILFGEDAATVSLIGEIILLPLTIGVTSFLVNFVEDKNFDSKDIFNYFKSFVKIVGTLLLSAVLITIASIFLVIPGIILALSYSLVPILLVKREDLGIIETLKLSRTLMNGHKLDAFVLSLSFIGWAFVGTLTLGIAYIWIYPYMSVTFTKFYLNILESSKELA